MPLVSSLLADAPVPEEGGKDLIDTLVVSAVAFSGFPAAIPIPILAMERLDFRSLGAIENLLEPIFYPSI